MAAEPIGLDRNIERTAPLGAFEKRMLDEVTDPV
jgi:hypothetical protein